MPATAPTRASRVGGAGQQPVGRRRRRSRGRGRSRCRTAGARCTRWPRARQPVGPGVGRVALDRDRGPLGGGPRVEAGDGPAQHPAAGADRRRPGVWPWWNSRAASCSRICGWASPPIVPNTARSQPSAVVASAGHRVCGGRRPGAELGRVAGARGEAEAAVVQVDAGGRLDQPRAEARRRSTGSATRPCRSPSTVHRYVVSPSAAGGRRRDGPQSGSIGARRGRRSRRRSAAPSAPSCEHVGPVVAGGGGRLDQQVGPLRVVGIVGQVEPRRRARAAPSSR